MGLGHSAPCLIGFRAMLKLYKIPIGEGPDDYFMCDTPASYTGLPQLYMVITGSGPRDSYMSATAPPPPPAGPASSAGQQVPGAHPVTRSETEGAPPAVPASSAGQQVRYSFGDRGRACPEAPSAREGKRKGWWGCLHARRSRLARCEVRQLQHCLPLARDESRKDLPAREHVKGRQGR